jgi:trimethylamine--corrinoid protein Co-methyltransferase
LDKLYTINNAAGEKDLSIIHDYSCKILKEVGMKFISEEILDSLEENGAKIDREKSVAFFTQKLIEEKLHGFSDEIKSGRSHIMRNGGVAVDIGDKIFCKFGSIAPRFFDWDSQSEREAAEEDLVNAIRLGDAVEEIGMVGCPMYIKKIDEKPIDPNFTPIVNAMLLAKNTKKLGNSEVNSLKQLKYLMEMGIVLRGSLEEYRNNPVFLTAKESISPLLLDKNACEVLIALAENGLPATMIPMPILGAGVPVAISGAVALTYAEIIATMTAIRCVVPGAMVGGSSMASYMDMSGRGIKFNVMDAIKVDMFLSQIFEELHGLDYGYGIYSSDAKKLGSEVLVERMFKVLGAFFVKKYNYVIGLYDQGMVFSPELALAEIEMTRAIHELCRGFELDDLNNDLLLELKNVSHGGNFMASMHTLNNFKNTMRLEIMEEVFDSKSKKTIGSIYERANKKYKDILNSSGRYKLPQDKSKEIDKIVAAAHKDIIGRQW